MDKKLYGVMNWPAIEGIVYSESNSPRELLGGHVCSEGFLIQVFRPEAVEVKVRIDGKQKIYEMDKVDESGFFAVLIPGRKKVKYTLIIENIKGKKIEMKDPYEYPSMIKSADIKAFHAGIHYSVYKMLGSHIVEIDGVSGVNFAIWEPDALRVSVVGDFNQWDGRVSQMQRIDNTGIYELFIPDVKSGDIYKFEVKNKGGAVSMKADPFALYSEVSPDTASIVYDINGYKWNDELWINNREKENMSERPVSIYELHLGTFRMRHGNNQKKYLNYRELASLIVQYVKDMRYTHIELMPITEYYNEESSGYEVTGYYAPTSRYGTPDDFMYFVDEIHKAGIGIILDWVPVNYRVGAHGYESPEVRNILIGSALLWAEHYHMDGIRMNAVEKMLYLDYDKNPGEWQCNLYGGNENLYAIELIKHITSIFKKRKLSTVLIAEETSAWPQVTGKVNEECLGYDYKWNTGWINEFTEFMKFDPIYRKVHYGELTYSMLYHYSENFILAISHEDVINRKGSMLSQMPGDSIIHKISNLRVAYGYLFTYPGKKLIFMGQDFGQNQEWRADREIQWELLDMKEHESLRQYVKALNSLYKTQPSLYEQDYVSDGFEWINNTDADKTILSFVRRDSKGNELIVIVNFTPVERKEYRLGVPTAAKYKEIFNSDCSEYGGKGSMNGAVIHSEEIECDGRDNSIRITVPPLGISVFEYKQYTKYELEEMKAIAVKEKAEKEARLALIVKEEAEMKAKAAIEAEKKAQARLDRIRAMNEGRME